MAYQVADLQPVYLDTTRSPEFLADPYIVTGTPSNTRAYLTGTSQVPVTASASTLTRTNNQKTFAQFKQAIVGLSPYIYLPCDEGSGTTLYDASGNGRNATITGDNTPSTMWASTGITSYGPSAMHSTYSGQYAQWTGTIPVNQSFTVLACFYMPTLQNYGNQIMVNSSAWSGFTMHQAGDGTLYVGTDVATRAVLTGTFTSNKWYVVAFKQNRETGWSTVYVNGVQKFNAFNSIQTPSNAGTIFKWVGQGGDAYAQNLTFFNYAVSDSDLIRITSAMIIAQPVTQISGSTSAPITISGVLTNRNVSLAGSVSADVTTSGAITTPKIGLKGTASVDISLDPATVDLAYFRSLESSVSLNVTTDPATITLTSMLTDIDGTADVDVTLSATASTVAVTGLSATVDIPVGLSGEAGLSSAVSLAGEISADADLSGTLSKIKVPLAGSIDAQVYLLASTTAEVLVTISGTTGIPVLISGSLASVNDMPSTESVITLSTTSGTMTSRSILLLNPMTAEIVTQAMNRYRVPLSLPADPAPAVLPVVDPLNPDGEPVTEGTPAVAGGLLVRALHGVIVDMPTPTITDGKPT